MPDNTTPNLPIIHCPHCNDMVIIEEFNCGIFRHGILIETNCQMDPHAPKELCDYLYNHKLIYGCGRPFKIGHQNNRLVAEKCDYI